MLNERVEFSVMTRKLLFPRSRRRRNFVDVVDDDQIRIMIPIPRCGSTSYTTIRSARRLLWKSHICEISRGGYKGESSRTWTVYHANEIPHARLFVAQHDSYKQSIYSLIYVYTTRKEQGIFLCSDENSPLLFFFLYLFSNLLLFIYSSRSAPPLYTHTYTPYMRARVKV